MIGKTDAGSQNEKTMVDPKKIPKTPENTDDEQEAAAKQLKKAPKTPEFVGTDSDDSDNEQEP